jgi:hypothetical protein
MSAYPNIDVNQIVKQFNQKIKNAKTMEDLSGLEDNIFVLMERLKILQENLEKRADTLELYESYALNPSIIVGDLKIVEFCGEFCIILHKTNKEVKSIRKKDEYRWLGSAEAMRNDPEVQEIIASLN